MKQILFFILEILCLQACTSKSRGFEVFFDIQNAGECTVIASWNQTGKMDRKDTLQMKTGKVVYRGNTEQPIYVYFVFKGMNKQYLGSVDFLLDNSIIKVEGDFKDLDHLHVQGARADDALKAIKRNGKAYFDRYSQLSEQECDAFLHDQSKLDSLMSLCKKTKGEILDYLLSTPGYSNSDVMAYIIYNEFRDSDIQLLGKALENFNASMESNIYVMYCKEVYEKGKKLLPGQLAPNFLLSDMKGQKYRLSDFRGKYVLIEFSASWCGWCKFEIPFLKKVHENTAGKDFVMFTINLDDNKEKWEEVIQKDNLPWPVISDLKAFDSPVSKEYNISGIPSVFLIRPDGKIDRNDLRGDAMIKYINSIFDK